KKDILVITGDWNAKVGNDNRGWESAMGKYGYGSRNERGERLLEFATLHNLVISNTLFQQKPSRKWTWESPDADEKRKAKQTKHLNQNLNEKYKELCKKEKKFARKDKEGWIEDQCKEIQEGLQVGNSKQAYNLVKLLKRKYVSKLNIIRKKDGKIAQSKEDVLQTWTQYCSGLYEDIGGGESFVKDLEDITPPDCDDNTNTNNILLSEIENAIDKLKKNKSPGTDGITAEMLQAGGKQLVSNIHELCNRAWKEEAIPDDWGRSILIPIPKKGDLTECSNYRTISLINHTGKVMLMVLLNRLKHQLEPFLSEEQAGFRKDRSTVQQILILRLLAEKAKRNAQNYMGYS
ncbi:unnamed protein product, partial [Rotaria magnacalcarata]